MTINEKKKNSIYERALRYEKFSKYRADTDFFVPFFEQYLRGIFKIRLYRNSYFGLIDIAKRGDRVLEYYTRRKMTSILVVCAELRDTNT